MQNIIDGREMSREIRQVMKEQFAEEKRRSGKTPRLASIVACGEKEVELYLKVQEKTAKEIGIDFVSYEFDERATQEEIIERINVLNEDPLVTAIIVQHPLPAGMDYDRVVYSIRPEKDAEGIHPYNLGKIFRRKADIVPCTPGAVMKILDMKKVDLYSKNVVIIGHSPIVGKPLSLMMLNETATTTVCHIGTYERGDITDFTRGADILVVAVGRAGMVKSDWIKEGAIVIDVGINNVSGKIMGDVELDSVKHKASMVTPVPGGVGPVTVSILMRNVLRSYRVQHG